MVEYKFYGWRALRVEVGRISDVANRAEKLDLTFILNDLLAPKLPASHESIGSEVVLTMPYPNGTKNAEHNDKYHVLKHIRLSGKIKNLFQ